MPPLEVWMQKAVIPQPLRRGLSSVLNIDDHAPGGPSFAPYLAEAGAVYAIFLSDFWALFWVMLMGCMISLSNSSCALRISLSFVMLAS